MPAFAADLSPQHGGSDACKQKPADFCSVFCILQMAGIASNLNTETKGADCTFPEGGEVVVTEKTWTPKSALQEQRLCKDATEDKFKFWQSNNPNGYNS